MVSLFVLVHFAVTQSTALVWVLSYYQSTRMMIFTCIGNITLGDILEILPFEDPIVVIELDGESFWAALEASLSTWPAQEGCAVM
jgi:hypothetical protein